MHPACIKAQLGKLGRGEDAAHVREPRRRRCICKVSTDVQSELREVGFMVQSWYEYSTTLVQWMHVYVRDVRDTLIYTIDDLCRFSTMSLLPVVPLSLVITTRERVTYTCSPFFKGRQKL